jgi:hypothetical protein
MLLLDVAAAPDFSSLTSGTREEHRMVRATCFYLAIIGLLIGTVASYVVPLPWIEAPPQLDA